MEHGCAPDALFQCVWSEVLVSRLEAPRELNPKVTCKTVQVVFDMKTVSHDVSSLPCDCHHIMCMCLCVCACCRCPRRRTSDSAPCVFCHTESWYMSRPPLSMRVHACVCACVFAHLPVAHTRALRFHGGLMRLIGAQKYDQDTAVMHINMTWYDAVYLRSSARNLKDGGDRASRALGLLGKGLERYLGKMAGGKVPPQVVVTILGAYRVVRLPVLLFVCCVTGEA